MYRTIDFRTNEFRGLEGGETYEPVEGNPMIGYRGCYRYVREPDLFALELELLARVREETPNLHLMIPFVRTKWELEACLEAALPAVPTPDPPSTFLAVLLPSLRRIGSAHGTVKLNCRAIHAAAARVDDNNGLTML